MDGAVLVASSGGLEMNPSEDAVEFSYFLEVFVQD